MSWWRRLRRAVLVRVARIASARVRGLLVELAVEREVRAAQLAEHEVQVRALNARIDVLRADADRATQNCDIWRGLCDDAQARYVAEVRRTNESWARIGAIANVADDPTMPSKLAARIRGLAGRSEQLPNQENNPSDLRKEEEVRT